MAVAERLVGGWQCMRRWEGNLEIGRIDRPGLSHRGCHFVKGLGSPARPIVGRYFQQQQTRGVRTSRRDGRTVRCVAQPVKGEALAKETSQLTQYNDSWLEVKAVEFLTERIAYVGGKTTDLKGYDGFVDITRKFVHGLPSSQQRDRVNELLHLVLPQWLIFCSQVSRLEVLDDERALTSWIEQKWTPYGNVQFRTVPQTKGVKELCAKFTLVFFKWLVGECEVREGAVDGEMIKSTVYIKKCRYLEQSQCVGQCVNLCKNPTQTFIREQFGMPLTMNPNFEDMSCEMIYGLHPPPLEEDAAYQQPCYTLCPTAKAKPNCA